MLPSIIEFTRTVGAQTIRFKQAPGSVKPARYKSPPAQSDLFLTRESGLTFAQIVLVLFDLGV